MKTKFKTITTGIFLMLFASINAQHMGTSSTGVAIQETTSFNSNALYSGGYYGFDEEEFTGGMGSTESSSQGIFVLRFPTEGYNSQLQIGSDENQDDKLFFRKVFATLYGAVNSPWYECATRGTNNFSGLQRFYVTPNTTLWLEFNSSGKTVHLDGALYTKEIFVRTDVWPDNVFAKEYHLPSLSSVEQYISTNNHLPEIPSEKEVLENGIDLAQMNVLLLKKVEELTLHLIQQDKRIQELENQTNND